MYIFRFDYTTYSQAFENIEKFLKPNGRLIQQCPLSKAFFGAFLELSKDEMFAPYMTNVNDFTPNFHFSGDPVMTFREGIEASNLVVEYISLRDEAFTYENELIFKSNIKQTEQSD